ncbi:hypothetical protein ACKGJY_13260 [Hyunsoonleella sp. 2307UL5-6]
MKKSILTKFLILTVILFTSISCVETCEGECDVRSDGTLDCPC